VWAAGSRTLVERTTTSCGASASAARALVGMVANATAATRAGSARVCILTRLPAGGRLDRAQNGARLVARLVGLGLRIARLARPGAGRHLEGVAGAHGRADRDREVEIPRLGHVAHGAAVDAAGARLELADDLHRADLRR